MFVNLKIGVYFRLLRYILCLYSYYFPSLVVFFNVYVIRMIINADLLWWWIITLLCYILYRILIMHIIQIIVNFYVPRKVS